MSAEELEVVHAEGHVGTLERYRGRISFTYNERWRHRPDATPLSVSMPLSAARHHHRVIDPFLWGLLPDNDRVLARWAREFGVSAAHPFGLLGAIGADLPGAMQILTPEATVGSGAARSPTGTEPADGADGVEWLSEDDVAELLGTVRRDHTAWLGAHAEGRWSLAGAQPKIALVREDGRWGRPSGRVPTTHILKPAITGFDDHDLNEHVCLSAARRLGLRAVRTAIESFGDERAVVIDRYDRVVGPEGTLQRVHQEDVCQALAVHPERKYQSDGSPDPAAIVRLLRAHMPHDVAARSIDAFVDALAFSWVIGAPDAHAKNYALLLSGPQVRLAPLYDIASALAYPDVYEPKIRLAMKVGGYYLASAVRRHAWERLADELHLDPDAVCGRVAAIAARAPRAFAEVGASCKVAALRGTVIERLVAAVAERARRCADAMC